MEPLPLSQDYWVAFTPSQEAQFSLYTFFNSSQTKALSDFVNTTDAATYAQLVLYIDYLIQTGVIGGGVPGPEGAQGPPGATGAQGATGPQGIQGIQGIPGQAGSGVLIRGVAYGVSDLPPAPAEGDMYIAMATFNLPSGATVISGDGIVWATPEWISVGPIRGPQGAQGNIGATGIQGIQGPQGIQGIQGPAGTNGTNGTNGATGATGPAGTTSWNGLTDKPANIVYCEANQVVSMAIMTEAEFQASAKSSSIIYFRTA